MSSSIATYASKNIEHKRVIDANICDVARAESITGCHERRGVMLVTRGLAILSEGCLAIGDSVHQTAVVVVPGCEMRAQSKNKGVGDANVAWATLLDKNVATRKVPAVGKHPQESLVSSTWLAKLACVNRSGKLLAKGCHVAR